MISLTPPIIGCPSQAESAIVQSIVHPKSLSKGAQMRLKAALTAMVLSIVLIAALAISCFGQRTMATLGGVVEDETHAVLPGVQVRLLNEGTSAVLEQLTNERGEFLFDFVPVGTYTLKLEMAGFKNLESRNISAGAAQRSEERRVGKECRSRWSPYH